MFVNMDNYDLCEYIEQHKEIELQAEDFEKVTAIWTSQNYKKRSVMRMEKLALDLGHYPSIPLKAVTDLVTDMMISIQQFDQYFKNVNKTNTFDEHGVYTKSNLEKKVQIINSFLVYYENTVRKDLSSFIFRHILLNPDIENPQTIQKIKLLIEKNMNTYFKRLKLVEPSFHSHTKKCQGSNLDYLSTFIFSSDFTIACLKFLDKGVKACFPMYKIASPLIVFVVKKLFLKFL